jgi:Holliday junction resolvase
MAGTPESKVKSAVVKLLVKYGVYYFFVPANGYGRAGVPDIVCCADGKFLAIECKAGAGKTTALQDREIEKIQSAKGHAIVARETNLDMVELLIQELIRHE